MSKKTNEVALLLEEFFTSYLPDVKGLSENTIIAYQYAFQLLFRFMDDVKGLPPEKVTFASLSEDTIEEFLLHLERERKIGVKTRNLRRAALVTFAKFAAKRSFSVSLPFYTGITQLPKKKEPKSLRGYKHFSKEEVAILLNLPDIATTIGQRNLTLLSMLYATGARAQELCDITLADIALGSPSRIWLTGKGNKIRVVTIPDSCTLILKEYLRSRGFDPRSQATKKRHLFSSQTNEHMSPSCVGEIVKKYVCEAKELHPLFFREPSYSPHSFRHSIAVHMLEAGDSLVAIKAFLGHASISSTCVYATVTPELANRYLDARGKPLPEAVSNDKPQSLPLALPFLYRHNKRNR